MKKINSQLAKECVELCSKILILCKSEDEKYRQRIKEYAWVLEQYSLVPFFDDYDPKTEEAYKDWILTLQSELLERL